MRHRIYVLLLCLLFCGGTLQAQRRHKKLREVDNIDITFLRAASLQATYFSRFVYCKDVQDYFAKRMAKLKKHVEESQDSVVVVRWSCESVEVCEFLTLLSYLKFESANLVYHKEDDSWEVGRSCVSEISRWFKKHSSDITVEKVNHCYLSRLYIPKQVVDSDDYDVAGVFINCTPTRIREYLRSRGLKYVER